MISWLNGTLGERKGNELLWATRGSFDGAGVAGRGGKGEA